MNSTLFRDIAVFIPLAWKLYQVRQAPRDIPLRAVTLCVAFGAAAAVCEDALSKQALNNDVLDQRAAGPALLMLAHQASLLLLVYTLICFFLFSTLDSRGARIRAAWQAVPMVVALTIVTITALILRSTGSPADYPLPTVSIHFLAADTYMVYGLVLAFAWTRRYAKQAGQRLARGLVLTSIGLAALAAATALLSVVVVARWSGHSAPEAITTVEQALLSSGAVIFLIGVCYPGAAMRLVALRIWWRHVRAYHRLRPLWGRLHTAFPDDALSRVSLPLWRDIISLHGVHRRYYRRVIECRDGLVRISPYIVTVRENGLAARPLADQLSVALELYATGEPVHAPAIALASPTSTSLDADVHELVVLSQALRTTQGAAH